jgi:cyanobactin maturation PatA/PatG family protease
VSGIVALLMSEQIARGERPDARKIRAAILKSTAPCDPRAEEDCRRLIAGRLNIAAARARLAAGSGEWFAARKISSNGGNLNTPAAPMLPGAVKASGEPAAETGDVQALLSNGLEIGICMTNQPKEKRIYMSNKEHDGSEGTISTGTAAYEDTFIEDAAVIESAGVAPQGTGLSEEVDAVETPSGVQASDCSCKEGNSSPCKGGCKGAKPQPVYVLGQIGYDFGTEARRDQFVQLANINPYDPQQLADYLKKEPSAAASLIWTLSLDSTIIYAVSPHGAFADVAYDRLREALEAQLNEGADRLSLPGLLSGSARLLNGQVVPVINPDIRGLFSWNMPTLVNAIYGTDKEDTGAEAVSQKSGIRNFLDRVYYEVRNLGLLPQERAMNYAATNAFQVESVFRDAVLSDLKLDQIDVEPSPLCRPGSDCWDVKLIFFNPANRFEQARHVYRFTVDVSDTIPVSVGPIRDWDIY